MRSAYFAGKAAMAVWPTQMLDKLAGTRTDARPSCRMRQGSAVPGTEHRGGRRLQGPDGPRPAPFGEVTSWTVTADSDDEPARRFVEYFLTDGYADWLAIAPEERVPVRSGSTANPAEYADAWRSIPVATGRTERIRHRSMAGTVLSAVLQGSKDLEHWGHCWPGRGGELLRALAMTKLGAQFHHQRRQLVRQFPGQETQAPSRLASLSPAAA